MANTNSANVAINASMNLKLIVWVLQLQKTSGAKAMPRQEISNEVYR